MISSKTAMYDEGIDVVNFVKKGFYNNAKDENRKPNFSTVAE